VYPEAQAVHVVPEEHTWQLVKQAVHTPEFIYYPDEQGEEHVPLARSNV